MSWYYLSLVPDLLNINLTQLFKSENHNRRIAFSINYSFMNIGFVGSFILAGVIQSYGAYTIVFYTAAAWLSTNSNFTSAKF